MGFCIVLVVGLGLVLLLEVYDDKVFNLIEAWVKRLAKKE